MKKRLFSFLLVLMCICSFSLSAFAKDIDDVTADDAAQIVANPYLWYAQNQMLGVEKGTGVTLVCPNGDYKTLYTGGTLVTCPYDGEALELASAGGVTAKRIPEGIGRKDIIGYQDNNGTPSVNQSGLLNLFIPVAGWQTSYRYGGFLTSLPDVGEYIIGKDLSYTKAPSGLYPICSIEAPVSGLYTYTCTTSPYVATGKIYVNQWTERYWYSLSSSKAYDKGQTIYFLAKVTDGVSYNSPCVVNGYGINVTVEPLGESRVTNYNRITINNNNWNGNIYVDNTNNLTYIYPQYTTINENGDTITNISTNPIIYNSETKQYYTYDSVTQNYYYIIYNENSTTPTPTPSPDNPDVTPTPSPDIPTITPTPTPGGGSSGGGSGSNISGGSDEGLFGWLWDLLKDLVKAILKAIFKVLSGILGFLIWLVERVGLLFPFLPAPAVAALGAGVVLVFVIKIIRFIRG